MVADDAEREVNEPAPAEKHERPMRFALTFWLVIGGVLVLVPSTILLLADASKWTRKTKTQVIMNSLKTGYELGIAARGSSPEAMTFDQLLMLFAHSTALEELRSLKAVDDQHHCFVDGWGHPISITQNGNNAFVVVSPGPDGILGTKDDL